MLRKMMVPKWRTIAAAEEYVGGLSNTSKMPCYSYSLPPDKCFVGNALSNTDNTACKECYAKKNRYAFNNVKKAMLRRWYTLDKDHWVEAFTFIFSRRKCTHFRWHDSGDIESIDHLHNIVEVARRSPHVKFWLPTREVSKLKVYTQRNRNRPMPENLTIRISAPYIDKIQTNLFGNYPTANISKNIELVNCPAYKQGGKCGDCRKCWDPKESNIIYAYH
jgi:hypothetical protein